MIYHKPSVRRDPAYPQLDLSCALDGRALADLGSQIATFVLSPSDSIALELNTKTVNGYRTERQTFNQEQALALRDFLNANLKGTK